MDELILKYLQGEASETECFQVLEWIQTNPENFKTYEELRDIWFAAGLIKELPTANLNERYQALRFKLNIKKQANESRKIVAIPEWLKIAAVFVFAFLFGILMSNYRYFNGSQDSSIPYVVEAPYGAKLKMNLADGTRVWLNAGSELTYTNQFNLNDRKVILSGEAYFEVAKNKILPFVVQSGDVHVKAVGTAFNVKAYSDEKYLETTLVEGKVEVSLKREKLIMNPKQSLHVDCSNQAAEEQSFTLSENINTDLYTSWRGKRWIFEREAMLDFAKKIERRYDVKISFADPRVEHYRITGSIEQQTLGELLKALRLTIPLDYRIQENEVVLSINEKLKQEYESLLKN